MNLKKLFENSDFNKAAAMFASGYAKRLLETPYNHLMETEPVKQIKKFDRPTIYGIEAVLNGIVAYLSIQEGRFANTPVKEFLWQIAQDAPSEISKRLLDGQESRDQSGSVPSALIASQWEAMLEGLLRMNAQDLNIFLKRWETATPQDRRQMAEVMLQMIDHEQEKTIEPLRLQVKTPAGAVNGKEKKGPGIWGNLTGALRSMNEHLEKRKGSAL